MEKSCQCENPMIGKGRQGQKHWLKTSHENSDSVISVKDSADVIFYGDSITEGWKETSYGFYNGRKAGNKAIFDSLFTIGGGGKYEGIPMGISGDRVCHYYLYCYYFHFSFLRMNLNQMYIY